MQGQYDDGDTGLYYNTFRYYDPDAGRYCIEDPIGLSGGNNLYAYAGGNPFRHADPWGLRWRYQQTTGQLDHVDDTTGAVTNIGTGYAGRGDGYNNPNMQNIQDVGPIPQGTYTIGPAYNHQNLGPTVMNIDPNPGTDTFGRSLFRIHGYNGLANNTASSGCIVQNPVVRNRVRTGVNNGDNQLEVIP
jgi:RHS repeat-associated protein